MLPALEGFTAALLGACDAPAREQVAHELASLQRSILAQPELRGVLADTSLTGVARGAVVEELLRGRVGDVTRRLAVYAAAHAPAPEVAPAIGEVAQRALVHHETGVYEHQSLGLLGARRRVAGFADAVLSAVPTEEFGTVQDELFSWARVVEAHVELRRVLLDRDAPLAQRLGTVNRLLENRVSATTLTLARYVVEGGRPRDVVGTLDYLVDYVAQAHDWRVARVHAALPLEGAAEEELRTSLSGLTGAPVDLQVILEPALMSGVVVEVGDLRLDASMRGRLAALHDMVAGGHFYESALSEND
ncbi:MAG: F0F1 ATP synthase subunit delta [Acidobacteria bacterium]|nr:F0F1 ATP synthase subunit delta [Acidobacteriota bacterium]